MDSYEQALHTFESQPDAPCKRRLFYQDNTAVQNHPKASVYAAYADFPQLDLDLASKLSSQVSAVLKQMASNQVDWYAETNRYLKAKTYRWLRYRITSEDEPEPTAQPLQACGPDEDPIVAYGLPRPADPDEGSPTFIDELPGPNAEGAELGHLRANRSRGPQRQSRPPGPTRNRPTT